MPKVRTCAPGFNQGRRWLSVERAELQKAWHQFAGRLPWTQLATLTFDPKRFASVSANHAQHQIIRWCNWVEWGLRRPVLWLVAVERNRSGSHHGHVLFGDCLDDLEPFAQCWRAGRGIADLRAVKNSAGLVLYASKEAAASGYLVLSDSVSRYRGRLNETPAIALQ